MSEEKISKEEQERRDAQGKLDEVKSRLGKLVHAGLDTLKDTKTAPIHVLPGIIRDIESQSLISLLLVKGMIDFDEFKSVFVYFLQRTEERLLERKKDMEKMTPPSPIVGVQRDVSSELQKMGLNLRQDNPSFSDTIIRPGSTKN